MAAAAPFIPYLLGATAVGSLALGIRQSNKLEDAQGEQQQLDQAKAADQAARERRKQIRQRNVAQAQIENAAAASGQQGSSAPIAAVSSVQSQVNENIGAIDTAKAFGDMSGAIQQDIFNLQQPSTAQQVLGATAGLAGSIFEVPKIKVK